MPALPIFKRDNPASGLEPTGAIRRSRLPLILFLVTHGMWLATSLAGLILAIGNAHSEPGFVVVASLFTGP